MFCPTIISCFTTKCTNKFTAAPWVAPLALLLLIYAWKRSKNQQFLPNLLLRKCANAMLTIAFALLGKMKSQPFMCNKINCLDPDISVTVEHENNDQIAFLDTLVSLQNGTIYVGVYRKPTITNRYLDFNL